MPKVCGVTCFVIAACRAASCTASQMTFDVIGLSARSRFQYLKIGLRAHPSLPARKSQLLTHGRTAEARAPDEDLGIQLSLLSEHSNGWPASIVRAGRCRGDRHDLVPLG